MTKITKKRTKKVHSKRKDSPSQKRNFIIKAVSPSQIIKETFSFIPGSTVKCIKDMSDNDKRSAYSIGYSIPIVGKTYLIRATYRLEENLMLLLDEIKNPDFIIGKEMGFFSTSFKVLHNPITPIAIQGRAKECYPDYVLKNMPDHLRQLYFSLNGLNPNNFKI